MFENEGEKLDLHDYMILGIAGSATITLCFWAIASILLSIQFFLLGCDTLILTAAIIAALMYHIHNTRSV